MKPEETFNAFLTGLINTLNNFMSIIGMLLSSAYIVYHFVFLKVVVVGTAAMQLEDSTAAYAVGKQLATGGGMYTVFLFIAGLVFVYNARNLFFNNKKAK